MAPEAKVFMVGTHKDKLSNLAQTIIFRGKQYKQRKIAEAQKILADFLPGLYVAKNTNIIENIEQPSPQEWFFAVDNKSRERGGKCSDEVIHTLRDRLHKALMNDQRKVQGLFTIKGEGSLTVHSRALDSPPMHVPCVYALMSC